MGLPTGSMRLPDDRCCLIAVNEMVLATQISKLMESLGYLIMGPVYTTEDGLNMLATFIPEICILDKCLQEKSTLSMAIKLRMLWVPTILLTDANQPTRQKARFEEGPVLKKPITGKDLEMAVAEVLDAA